MKRISIKKSAIVFATLIGLFVTALPVTSWSATAEQMRSYIIREFKADPRIDASKLRVKRQNEMFVVSGTVENLAEYNVVERILQRLTGDNFTITRIKIVPGPISDERIESTIESLIPSHCLVRIKNFSVKSRNGAVTLRGTTNSLHHSMSAEHAATQIRGIKSIDNQIRVTSTSSSDAHMRDYIAGLAQPYVERYNIKDFKVSVKNGKVKLYGTTTSYEARNRIVELAEMVDGVTKVQNYMRSYAPNFDTVHDHR